MTHELATSQDLLSLAAEKKKQNKLEKQSIEEAAKKIPQLTKKVLELMGPDPALVESPDDPKKPQTVKSEDGKIHLTEEFFRKMREDEIIRKTLRVFTYSVPVDDEKIGVTISQGLRTGRYSLDRDPGIQIDVHVLDSVLRLDGDTGIIEAKAHNHREFTMHTPIGPGGNSDLGPVWSRKMNMEDFNAYNQLLDRLTEPDVEVKGEEKPIPRTRNR